MTGLLITNKYMTTEKFIILKNGFISASKKVGIELMYMDNFSAYRLLDSPISFDFILFYDKDIKLAKALESKGYRLFNKSEPIAICDDKGLTYLKLLDKVREPKTIISPFLYYGNLSGDIDFINKCENAFYYPMIVKECLGSFGFQVYKVDNREQFIDCITRLSTKPFIVQEFIDTSFGKDLRLQVIGDEVVCAMKRINENGDFRANVTNGAKAYEYFPTESECNMAITAAKIIGADFAGVDLLFGENEPILCEVNSNAHIENISNICNIDVYSKILSYIVKMVK